MHRGVLELDERVQLVSQRVLPVFEFLHFAVRQLPKQHRDPQFVHQDRRKLVFVVHLVSQRLLRFLELLHVAVWSMR